jgi:hypothetical protein
MFAKASQPHPLKKYIFAQDWRGSICNAMNKTVELARQDGLLHGLATIYGLGGGLSTSVYRDA